jgi:hypothetical protein
MLNVNTKNLLGFEKKAISIECLSKELGDIKSRTKGQAKKIKEDNPEKLNARNKDTSIMNSNKFKVKEFQEGSIDELHKSLDEKYDIPRVMPIDPELTYYLKIVPDRDEDGRIEPKNNDQFWADWGFSAELKQLAAEYGNVHGNSLACESNLAPP